MTSLLYHVYGTVHNKRGAIQNITYIHVYILYV